MESNMKAIIETIKIILSKFQAAILSAVRKEKQNLIVGAVAGSGKTFTLLQIAKEIKGTACFCAFNKTIANEIGEKLKEAGCSNFQARTIHSLAFGAVKKKFKNTRLDESKYANLVKNYLEDLPEASDAIVDAVELREINL